MKENFNIDELLNGFIDGELTVRQQTEVQRLIKHDAQVAQRLQQLQRCKMLVGALPRSEAPEGMLERVKASLERRTLFGAEAGSFSRREGAKHLLGRRILAVAAMIGLVVVLGAVIYTIVAPESVPEKSFVSGTLERRHVKYAAGKPEPALTEIAGRSISKTPFRGRLELKTGDFIAADAFIRRAIEDNGISEYVGPAIQNNRSVYTLACSSDRLSSLLSDMENIWPRFNSATLFVEQNQLGDEIAVAAVTPLRIVEVIGQDSYEKRINAARKFAVLNEVNALLPGRQVFAAINGKKPLSITIPRPVLTSSEKGAGKSPSQPETGEKVQLIIVVAGGQ
jgi:hypothetical protein